MTWKTADSFDIFSESIVGTVRNGWVQLSEDEQRTDNFKVFLVRKQTKEKFREDRRYCTFSIPLKLSAKGATNREKVIRTKVILDERKNLKLPVKKY